jgi:hypothetical protein
VYCENIQYIFLDVYFECPDSIYQFDVLTAENLGFNSTFGRHACGAFAEFSPRSSASSTQVISKVAIATDDYWRANAFDFCYTRISSAAPVPLTNAPVTPTPTVVMNTTSPSLFPTLPPVDAPTSPSTNPPAVAAPAATLPSGATPTLTEETTDSGDSNNTGALIGSVVGGIAAAIVIGSLIGFFVFRRPADSSNVPKPGVSGGVAPSSMTKGTAGHDNLLGPAQPIPATQPVPSTTPIPPPAPAIAVAMPPPPASVAVPLIPSTTNNFAVDYKDQARTALQAVPAIAVAYKDQARTVIHEVPAIAVAETVAPDVSAASAGSQKQTQSKPPGRIYTEI